MADRFGDIVGGFERSLRKVQTQEGECGRINGASVFFAQQIVRLKDWAADQPEEFLPTSDLHPIEQERGRD